MKKIETLIIGGGGTNGSLLIGSLFALIEKDIIKKDYSNIKEIISCSVGGIIGIFILCKLSIPVIYHIISNLNLENLIDYNDLNILFDNYGLFNNNKIINIAKIALKKKYNVESISLKDLYELTNIKFVCKVFNINKKQCEFISYENNPELCILKLLSMSTCVPIFFKPIKYNNNYYIDGGVIGDFIKPKIATYDYIGLFIKNNEYEFNDNNIINYLNNILYSIGKHNNITNYLDNKKYIFIDRLKSNKTFVNFHKTNDVLIHELNYSYNFTIKYINNNFKD